MSTICPSCRSAIAVDDINVSTDLALCRACGKSFRFSEIVGEPSSGVPDLNSPPPGAFFEQLPDGFRVGATTRSGMAVFLVPFTCVWAGGSLSGIYGSQIVKGHFALGPSLFGLPFLIGSCFLISLCALYTMGQMTVTKSSDRLSIFVGVGGLGWTRNYLWSDFRTIRDDYASGSMNWNRQGRLIALEGKRRAAFGSLWTDERRYFVLQAIRAFLNGANLASGSTMVTGRFR
jgi:hypothetical protein